jgi:hypothetical protein
MRTRLRKPWKPEAFIAAKRYRFRRNICFWKAADNQVFVGSWISPNLLLKKRKLLDRFGWGFWAT